MVPTRTSLECSRHCMKSIRSSIASPPCTRGNGELNVSRHRAQP
jgi:hypothetical protein